MCFCNHSLYSTNLETWTFYSFSISLRRKSFLGCLLRRSISSSLTRNIGISRRESMRNIFLYYVPRYPRFTFCLITLFLCVDTWGVTFGNKYQFLSLSISTMFGTVSVLIIIINYKFAKLWKNFYLFIKININERLVLQYNASLILSL